MPTREPSAAEAEARKRLAIRMRQIRQQRNLTQENVAGLTGLDRSYLADMEAGNRNPSLGILARLAEGLAVTLGDLLD